MLDSARQQIRQGFREKASLPASDPSIAPALQHAEEVASFLKTNLVQGKREEGGKYSESLSPGVTTPPSEDSVADPTRRPELRIHEHTERGDNDSIKLGNKNASAGGVKCCSER